MSKNCLIAFRISIFITALDIGRQWNMAVFLLNAINVIRVKLQQK